MSLSDPPQSSDMNNMIVGPANDPYMSAYPDEPYYNAAEPQDAAAPKPMLDSSESAKMTPLVLVLLVFAGLKRSWKWALPAGFVFGACAAAACYLLFPVKYEAVAWIRIYTKRPVFLYNDLEEQVPYKTLVSTQISLIRAPMSLEKALESPEVAQLPCVTKEKDRVGWLNKQLRVGTQGESEMLTVSIQTEERTDAHKIVNAVVDAYFENYADKAADMNSKLISDLQKEYGKQQVSARYLQDEIRAGLEEAARQGGAAGQDGLSGGFAQNESLMLEVQKGESLLVKLRSELTMLQQMAAGDAKIPKTMIIAAIENDPQLAMLSAQLSEHKDRVRALRRTLPRDDDPSILNLENRIAELQKNFDDSFANMSSSKAQAIQMGVVANLEQQIMLKDMEVRSQEILVNELRIKAEEQKALVGTRTTKITDVTFQQNELARINADLDKLQGRISRLNLERFAPKQIELTKAATVPSEAKVKKRLPMAALGGMAGFCFPLFLGIALERIRPRLYHVSQIRRAMPNVIIGEIMEPPVAWLHGSNFQRRLARYRESVHNWSTHLLLSEPFRRCKTLSVASVSGDDGKTFLAVQVAVAMAQMKSGPVLLIDADMQVGRLHLLFGNEETGIGLADVLSFRNGFGEAVVMNEREPNLHLLSAGQLDVSPYELLGDGRFKELLGTLPVIS